MPPFGERQFRDVLRFGSLSFAVPLGCQPSHASGEAARFAGSSGCVSVCLQPPQSVCWQLSTTRMHQCNQPTLVHPVLFPKERVSHIGEEGCRHTKKTTSVPSVVRLQEAPLEPVGGHPKGSSEQMFVRCYFVCVCVSGVGRWRCDIIITPPRPRTNSKRCAHRQEDTISDHSSTRPPTCCFF